MSNRYGFLVSKGIENKKEHDTACCVQTSTKRNEHCLGTRSILQSNEMSVSNI